MGAIKARDLTRTPPGGSDNASGIGKDYRQIQVTPRHPAGSARPCHSSFTPYNLQHSFTRGPPVCLRPVRRAFGQQSRALPYPCTFNTFWLSYRSLATAVNHPNPRGSTIPVRVQHKPTPQEEPPSTLQKFPRPAHLTRSPGERQAGQPMNCRGSLSSVISTK